MNQTEFLNKIRKVLSKETSFDPNNWTENNPFYGHCAVIALLAQDFFGGKILRANLLDTPFFILKSHFWNFISSKERDFTKEQFGENKPKLIGEIRKRKSLLENKNTLRRYKLLKERFLESELGIEKF